MEQPAWSNCRLLSLLLYRLYSIQIKQTLARFNLPQFRGGHAWLIIKNCPDNLFAVPNRVSV